ncbi:MAG: helix-turn-helix transcriptional regulator [Nocardioidaceae bacterium]|nr:MAG: helix-turn-helix transcriptional regulator [Nocardioidaceae bacterium]
MGELAGEEVQNAATETMRRVGAQIRRVRKRRNRTLQQLSAETGMSVSMLSMLERGVAAPSIGTLVSVSAALGMHMSDLFDTPGSGRSPVRRLADQVEVNTAEGVVRRLVHNDPNHGLEMVVNEYEPGTSSSSAPTHHVGTELGILISGTLAIELDGVEHILKPGDGITYRSSTPHRFENRGKTKARAVWINLDA